MSLEGTRSGMLGVDRQHAGGRRVEPGTDPGVFWRPVTRSNSGGGNRAEIYGWVNETLRVQHYEELKRAGRGLIRRYVEKMTGLSRAQTTRLITRYQRGEAVKPPTYRPHRVPQRYTREDIALLAAVDEAHGTLSGPATRKLLERACYDFGEAGYRGVQERLCLPDGEPVPQADAL